MLTFPAVILPAFIVVALFLAVVLRNRSAASPWRYRDILTALFTVLAIACAMLLARGIPGPQRQADTSSEPTIEVDMLVSRGGLVELWTNDWQHPSEKLPAVAGERHVYRFTNIPREISLIRLDPTELADARIVIYSLAVRAGNQIVRQFGPAELKNWTLVNLSAPQEENGGLVLLDRTDDPILWTPVTVHLPAFQTPSPLWLQWMHRFWSSLLLVAALSVLLLMRVSTGRLAVLLNRSGPHFADVLTAPWCALVVALLVAGGTAYLLDQKAGSDAGVEVDMLISRGRVVELWANDWEHPSEQLPVMEGQRRVYRFNKLPRQLTLLRLDPTDLPDATVTIYSVDVKTANQTLLHFGPEELKHWTLLNLASPKDEGGGLVLNDTNDDPILWTRLALDLPGSLLAAIAAPLIETSDAPFLLAITASLLVLLARMSTPTGRIQAVLIAVAGCVAYPAVWLVMKLRLPPPPVTTDVGYNSYHGYAKADEFLAASVAMLICIALGYAFARLAGIGEEEEMPPGAFQHNRRRIVWLADAAVLCLLFVYFLPDVRGVLVYFSWAEPSSAHGTNLEFAQSLGQVKYQSVQWDARNQLTCAYLLHAGLRPFRDFWFTFSGAYLQLLPFPTGPIVMVVHCTVLLWVLYWSLFRITGRRLRQALVMFGLIFAPLLLGTIQQWDRYLTAADVALFYAAICESPFDWRTHAPFAAFVGYAFFFEPTQVLYAGAGIVAHTILSVLSRFRGPSLRERLAESARLLKQRFMGVGIPLLAGITASLLIYAGMGMLPGFWDFETSLGDQSVYGALPSEIARWVLPALQPDTVFLLMFLLASYAVYRWVRLKGRPDPLGTALVVLCGTAFMAMQKQIMRPHIMQQVRIFPYLALLIFGLIVWRERRPAARIVIAGFAGCILGIALQRGALREVFRSGFEAGPRKVAGMIHALRNHQEFAANNARMYSHVIGFDEEHRVVDNLLQSCGLRAEDNVYVLGDDSIFYILLNRQPPYLINAFTESPRYEQQRILEWLRQKNPRFVVWAPQDSVFDSVPNLVRIPLIYAYVIEHYEFVRAVGPYHILTQRPPNQPLPDLDYWRRMLGDRVDLAHVPARARLSEYAPCGGESARCDAVLVVKYSQSRPAPKGKVTVNIESPGQLFQVQFDVAPGELEYVVNLNRLWFWNAMSRLSKPRITADDAAVEAVMDYRGERSPVLY